MTGGVNPAFSLGTFHAESHSGTRGYATVTKNWGNILYYAWTADFGATPVRGGQRLHVRQVPDLARRHSRLCRPAPALPPERLHDGQLGLRSLARHDRGGDRPLTYLNNITAVMRILPDDAVPVAAG